MGRRKTDKLMPRLLLLMELLCACLAALSIYVSCQALYAMRAFNRAIDAIVIMQRS